MLGRLRAWLTGRDTRAEREALLRLIERYAVARVKADRHQRRIPADGSGWPDTVINTSAEYQEARAIWGQVVFAVMGGRKPKGG